MNKSGGYTRWIFGAIGLVLAVNLAAGIFDVPYYYYDEGVYVDAGQTLWEGHAVENWEHPPLGKYFILAGRLLTTEKVIGARWPAVVTALLSLLILGLAAEILFRGKMARGLATSVIFVLGLSDPLLVNLGKMAMLDIYLLLFLVMGIFLTIRQLTSQASMTWLWLGVSFGLAMAVKWSALPVFIVFFAALVGSGWSVRHLLLTLATAVTIYCGTFVPYLILLPQKLNWSEITALHFKMLAYHRGLIHPSLGPIFWVWLERGGDSRGLAATGNLATYALGAAGLVVGWRQTALSNLLIFAPLATVLFWAVLCYRQLHAYYFLPCSPFLYLGVALLFVRLHEKWPKWAYFAVFSVLLAFVFYQPYTRI